MSFKMSTSQQDISITFVMIMSPMHQIREDELYFIYSRQEIGDIYVMPSL